MKNIHVLICLMICNIGFAQVPVFEYITTLDAQYKTIPFHGHTYKGYVDNNDQPIIIGWFYDQSNPNDYTVGMIKNHEFDGWCYSPSMHYQGFAAWDNASKTIVPSGYGAYEVEPGKYMVADQSKSTGLGIMKCPGQYNHFLKNFYNVAEGKQISGKEAYSKILYEQKKDWLKQICAQKGIKYVEDAIYNHYRYSGGWKDGAAYYVGAGINIGGDYVFCGYIRNKNLDMHPKGYYEIYLDAGEGEGLNNVYFRQTIENGDTTKFQLGYSQCRTIVLDKDNHVKYLEQFDFGSNPQYARITHDFGGSRYWGILVGKNSIYEGEIWWNAKGFLEPYVKSELEHRELSLNGTRAVGFDLNTIYTYPSGNKYIYYKDGILDFPNNYALVEKIALDGSFTVGFFNSRENKPVYADEYDAQGNFIKSYVDANMIQILSMSRISRYNSAKKVEDKIEQMKNEHFMPLMGNGKIETSDYVYEGEFFFHKLNGKGVLKYKDQKSYLNGTFKNGLFVEGNGRIYMQDIDAIYEGELCVNESGNIVRNGRGKVESDIIQCEATWRNNRIYEGGFGSIKLTDGTYSGEFSTKEFTDSKENVIVDYFCIHGTGKMEKNNGDIYEGIWELNKFRQGTLTRGNGDRYDGSFINGNFSDGRISYANGDKYEGSFSRGHKGKGILTLRDGSVYQGDWTDKNMDSYFDITLSNGIEFHGWILNGMFHGDKVNYVDSLGNKYKGAMQQSHRSGLGQETFSNGDYIVATWDVNGPTSFIPASEYHYFWADGRSFHAIIDKNGQFAKGSYLTADGKKASKKDSKDWIFETVVEICDIDLHDIER